MQVVVIPTFISIVPQRTSIVELPFLAIVVIWTIRITEQTVVKPNIAKRTINTTCLDWVSWMCIFRRSGRCGIIPFFALEVESSRKVEWAR